MISTQNQKRFTHRHQPILICKAELRFSSAKKILNYHPFLHKLLEEQTTVLQRKAQKCQFFLRVVLTVLFFPRRVSIVLLSSQPTHQEPTESRSNPPKKGISQELPSLQPFCSKDKVKVPPTTQIHKNEEGGLKEAPPCHRNPPNPLRKTRSKSCR